jgi:hypothetical protein
MTASFSGSFNYTHLNANGTTTIKSAAGVLAAVSVNTKGASGNQLAVYDNTSASAPIIAQIDTTSAVYTFPLGVQFNTGLTVVLANGTAADITISWL